MITNYAISNNLYVQKPFSRTAKRSEQPGDVAFGGTGKSLLSSYLGFQLIMGALIFGGLSGKNENQSSKDVGWEPNVRVLAATGQNNIGIGTKKSDYSMLLMDLLDKKISTIEQANDSLIKSGYKINVSSNLLYDILFPVAVWELEHKNLYPLETPGTHLGIFNKDEKNKDRFVIIFRDKRYSTSKEATSNFSKKIKQKYDIPDRNIISIVADSLSDFQKGIDSVTKKIDKLKDKSNAELLVLYNGHGYLESLKDGDENFEGAMGGIFATKKEIKEKDIKALFKKKLEGIKTLFILDTCHSGAWIAEGSKTALRTLA